MAISDQNRASPLSPVLSGLLSAYVWRFQSSAPAVSQPASAGRATTPSQQVRTPIALQLRRSGTRFRTLFGTQRWVLTTLDRHWRLTCSRRNGTRSALEELHDALYKSTTTTTILLHHVLSVLRVCHLRPAVSFLPIALQIWSTFLQSHNNLPLHKRNCRSAHCIKNTPKRLTSTVYYSQLAI